MNLILLPRWVARFTSLLFFQLAYRLYFNNYPIHTIIGVLLTTICSTYIWSTEKTGYSLLILKIDRFLVFFNFYNLAYEYYKRGYNFYRLIYLILILFNFKILDFRYNLSDKVSLWYFGWHISILLINNNIISYLN